MLGPWILALVINVTEGPGSEPTLEIFIIRIKQAEESKRDSRQPTAKFICLWNGVPDFEKIICKAGLKILSPGNKSSSETFRWLL